MALPNGHREISRKLSTLQSSLRKVENVCYNINVRGTEVPKHMLGTYMEIGGSGSKPPPDYQEGDMEEDYWQVSEGFQVCVFLKVNFTSFYPITSMIWSSQLEYNKLVCQKNKLNVTIFAISV